MKGYIFDYGGTLDTAGCHWGRMIWRAYEHCGVPVDWEAFKEAYIFAERRLGSHYIIQPTFTFRDTLTAKIDIEMDYLRSHGYWDASDTELKSLHADVVDRLYRQTIAETQKSIGVLNTLKKDYKLALVSNFYGNISVILREFGFAGIFSAVIESAVVGVRKPDPRLFALGIEALGIEARNITVVGDSIAKDIIPAKSLGCLTVWLRGEPWEDDPDDIGAQADRIITTLSELCEH